MKWIVEDSLTNFKFWSGAVDNAKLLEYSELQELDDALPDLFGERTPTQTEINDLFWFDFETVCSLIGLKYDKDKDVIIRDENEDSLDESVNDTMKSVFESIRKENPAIADAMEAGYKACMEAGEPSVIKTTYSPDVVITDKPNYMVILASGALDPHPARVAVDAYDEADAIDSAVRNLAEHGLNGFVEEDQPEHPEDYIEVTSGWIPSELVRIEKCDGIRATYVPEHFLPALVNSDRTGMSEEDIGELDEFCKDLAEEGIPESGLSPVCGPDGEYWDVDEDPRTGKAVFCSVFAGH